MPRWVVSEFLLDDSFKTNKQTNKQPRGCPPKRWLDCISQDCKTRSITRRTDASWMAIDRSTWLTITIPKPPRGPPPPPRVDGISQVKSSLKIVYLFRLLATCMTAAAVAQSASTTCQLHLIDLCLFFLIIQLNREQVAWASFKTSQKARAWF